MKVFVYTLVVSTATLTAGCGSSSSGADDAWAADIVTVQDTATEDDAVEAVDVVEAPGTPVFGAMASPPEGSVLPDTVASCALYRETRCESGTKRVCDIYDSKVGDWSVSPPAMTQQAFMFDRYYDLYHRVEGQAMDFRFTKPVPTGTPEAEWTKPEYFRKYDGYGDASGWSGTAMGGAAGRFRATGTDADYERMVTMLEEVLFQYEVNDIPGMLIRSHWAMLPEGAPDPIGNWARAVAHYRPDDGSDGHFTYAIAEKFHDRLPEYYLDGVDIEGAHYDTKPRFQGDASRDMYVRGLPGILMAFDLLGDGEREDGLREVIRTELPCTLNRLRKGRIYNLDQNQDIKETLLAYIGGNEDVMILEEGELEVFTALDELIFYAMEQPHPLHMDSFDASCPDGPPMEVDPRFELDAASDTFLLDMVAMLYRLTGEGEEPLAWAQYVSVRGADVLFVTQWALTAHYLTGDGRYLEFLLGLMDEIDYWGIVHTYGALQMPRWCSPHFGPSLLYPTLWNLLGRIDAKDFPDYWAKLAKVVKEEGKDKDMEGRNDAYWGVLYNRMADQASDPDCQAYVQQHVDLLATYGMNPDDKLAPDRNYPRNFIDNPDPDIPLVDITPEQLALCTEPITIMGMELPAAGLEDDWPRAVDTPPMHKRVGGGFIWTIDPWMVKREYGGVGMDEQWPMLGMTVPYWMGRADGVITEGEGLALGWRDTGEECR